MEIIIDESWIIQHLPTGKYLGSPKTLVHNKVFAHRFKTRKQARVYRDNSVFDKDDCKITMLSCVKKYQPEDMVKEILHHETLSKEDPNLENGGEE